MGTADSTFLGDINFLFFKTVQKEKIAGRIDELDIMRIPIRALKPMHELSCKIRMEPGGDVIQHRKASGLKRRMNIKKYSNEMTDSRRLEWRDRRLFQAVAIKSEGSRRLVNAHGVYFQTEPR